MPTNILKRTKRGTLSSPLPNVCVLGWGHVLVRKCECMCVKIQTRCKPSYKHEESLKCQNSPSALRCNSSVQCCTCHASWPMIFRGFPHLDLRSHCTSTEITDTDYCIELSMGARDTNPGLMLAWQALYPSSHLPTPLFRTFLQYVQEKYMRQILIVGHSTNIEQHFSGLPAKYSLRNYKPREPEKP